MAWKGPPRAFAEGALLVLLPVQKLHKVAEEIGIDRAVAVPIDVQVDKESGSISGGNFGGLMFCQCGVVCFCFRDKNRGFQRCLGKYRAPFVP